MHFDLQLAKIILNSLSEDLKRHSLNVCYFSLKTAQYAGYDLNRIKVLAVGALIHDIGKSCIDEKILNKPGKLTENEFEIVKQHTVMGAKMIEQIDNSNIYLPIILYHHERWDGNGYEGLSGKEIPDLASIVSITDAFDAMTSPRPYQSPKTLTAALKELKMNKGIQFNPDLVDAFESCMLELIKSSHYDADINVLLDNIFKK